MKPNLLEEISEFFPEELQINEKNLPTGRMVGLERLSYPSGPDVCYQIQKLK